MSDRVALWGGLECSVARIGDAFRDQFAETGHRARPEDLQAVAALGIRTLRYPIVWESVAPDDPDICDWSWHDRQMATLQALGIAPIIGLVHHGSGPHYTDLLDPHFADGLARHASRVAERYPWVRMFTPVNEPLTTARFSGLYGHWYPHGRSYDVFLPILVNEIRATQKAMQAIRALIPDAQLVQTEDLGKTFSTPALQYQADHENERRWLGFDLLCGRVTKDHPFYAIMLANNVREDDLQALIDAPCRPDILGMNHYLTSERYLDERCDLYPATVIGGNGRERYADIEAVRADVPDLDCGPEARLREAWARYEIPLAITEAHLGCTRDEQIRWLATMWDAAHNLQRDGIAMKAVTIWSLFGAVDWNSLLTNKTGFYEPGAFDIRGEQTRATGLARMAASLAKAGQFDHPVLDGVGWWQRDDRYLLTPRAPSQHRKRRVARPLLIAGDGRLGRALASACDSRSLAYVMASYAICAAPDGEALATLMDNHKPWAIVNCCGFSAAACAHTEPDRCFQANVTAATHLAARAATLGLPYVMISTDLVFDGTTQKAYVEHDATKPMGVFGQTKWQAEQSVADAHQDVLILRTGPLFGAGSSDMLVAALRHAARDAGVKLNRDLIVSPTYIPDLADMLLDLLIDNEKGLWHLANDGAIAADDLLRRARADEHRHFTQKGRTGCNLSLTSRRGVLLPGLGSAIDRLRAVA